MADFSTLLMQCEELYRRACEAPETLSESSLADWMEGAGGSGVDRETARELRRVLRAALKLRGFWLDPPAAVPDDHGDWRTRVDIGLGTRAWRPLLAVARLGLERDPSEELFADVKVRFRVVTGEGWMEGVSYEEWVAGR